MSREWRNMQIRNVFAIVLILRIVYLDERTEAQKKGLTLKDTQLSP